MPYLLGLAGLGAFWLILLISAKKHPWHLVIGEDGQPSASKFQVILWTAAVIFAYLAIYQIRFSHGHPEGMPDLPQNLLIAMGISVVTSVSAKAIAVNASNNAATAAALAPPRMVATGPSVVAQGQDGPPVVVTPVMAAPEADPPIDQSGIFLDSTGSPDLGKIQLVFWTLIAVGIFLSGVFYNIHHPGVCTAQGDCKESIPDIGETLMILMGMGHGAYLGKKIAES